MFHIRLFVLFLLALWAPIAGAQLLSTVENVDDPELRAGLERAIGTLNGNDADRHRLQQRARTASQRAERYLRSEGYYAASGSGASCCTAQLCGRLNQHDLA